MEMSMKRFINPIAKEQLNIIEELCANEKDKKEIIMIMTNLPTEESRQQVMDTLLLAIKEGKVKNLGNYLRGLDQFAETRKCN